MRINWAEKLCFRSSEYRWHDRKAKSETKRGSEWDDHFCDSQGNAVRIVEGFVCDTGLHDENHQGLGSGQF